MSSRRRRRLRRGLLISYLVLLVASHAYRRFEASNPAIPDDCASFEAEAVRGGDSGRDDASGSGRELVHRDPGQGVRVVYQDIGPRDSAAPAILLLHGSPGSLRDFRDLGPRLAQNHRVVAPSLPGFGLSDHRIPDYSTLAHADYCLQLLDQLGIERVHLVAFSMGGGVALDLYRLAPDRVASISMVSAIGVQELELLGNYELNHVIHGIQWGLVWALENLVPHFGWLDDSMLDLPYARNFYDTDQRPFRKVLLDYPGPMLIIHARDDSLVPFAAAREHHRIVPQSELVVFESGNHFILWTDPQRIARPLLDFFAAVESGSAPGRAQANPERLAAATLPFREITVEPAHGLALFLLLLLIVTGTFITEDLTCIATGLLIANGRLSWEAGFSACFLGIYLGDQLLYLAGRLMGRAAVKRAPWKWIVSEEGLRLAAGWFERRGMMVILLSRFVPGTRLPTYLLAGAVRARYWLFAVYFFVAVALWTPLLVGLSVIVGQRAAGVWQRVEHDAFWVLALSFLTVLLVLRVILPAFTHRGRRLLLGRWRRLRHWEFWPLWVVYFPVVLRILRLSLRRGGFARVTAVNPAIPLGGLVGESKWEICQGLSGSPEYLARTAKLPGELPIDSCVDLAREFLATHGLDYPLVLKPDHGQRSEHVYILRDETDLRDRLLDLAPADEESPRRTMLLQEYVDGPEYGVFYLRHPGQARGRVSSLTRKLLPVLFGDGTRTVQRLILDDPRAVCMANAYMSGLAERLFDTPAPGEEVRLVELGSHCRGAIFEDASERITPELEDRIDEIARRYEGFYFGRFDLRVSSEEALREGRDFKILELNGLTGEATHIYDARYSAWDAWRSLGAQWEDAFAIAEENIAHGARPARLIEVLREVGSFLRGERS